MTVWRRVRRFMVSEDGLLLAAHDDDDDPDNDLWRCAVCEELIELNSDVRFFEVDGLHNPTEGTLGIDPEEWPPGMALAHHHRCDVGELVRAHQARPRRD